MAFRLATSVDHDAAFAAVMTYGTTKPETTSTKTAKTV